jgi:hypothetical protein
MDIPGFIALFTADGTFTDKSIDVTYRDADAAKPVDAARALTRAAALPDYESA